jgi:carbonic anhydrase/acetyltransferase-like protein (isoleucine patch superfamily)
MRPSLSVRIAESADRKDVAAVPIETLAPLARELGFEGLSMRASVVSVTSPPERVAEVKALLDRLGLQVSMVTGDVALAAGVNLWYGSVLRGDLARITLGPRVNIQDGCVVHTDYDAPQDVGEGVVVGHGAVLHGRRIGRDTLVGIGARLLSGCEVGEECLIAAGALVTEGRRIPPRSVVMGVPGKVVREVTPEDLQRTRAICAHYLEMAQRYARGAYPPPWTR